MNNTTTEVKIPISEFDKNLLNTADQELEGQDLRIAITKFYNESLGSKLDVTDVIVTSKEIILRWNNNDNQQSLNDQAIGFLQQGELNKGIELLELLISTEPSNTEGLYNLGMALSDAGRLDESSNYLKRCIDLNTDNARAWLALGVCHVRKGDTFEALKNLRVAHKTDSSDPYIAKTLGAYLVELNENLKEADELLHLALVGLPEDQQLWFNIGRLKEKQQDDAGADEAYIKTIDFNPQSIVGEAAKTARSKISERAFKDNSPNQDTGRPDAMMYCLGAIKKFDKLPLDEVQKITFEIAMLGASGLDVNDPAQKYSINSLSGNFSGLNLLCIEYVGFKLIDPSVDLGFDLTKEYELAQQMHQA